MKAKKCWRLKLLVAALALLAMSVALIGCSKAPPDTPPIDEDPPVDNTPHEPENVYFFKDGAAEYSLVYSDEGTTHRNYADKIFSHLAMTFNYTEMARYKYTDKTLEKEILIGATDRQVSKDLVAAVNAANESGKDFVWGYMYKDGKLAFYANSQKALEYGWQSFFDAIVHDDGLYCLDNLYSIGVKKYSDYMYEVEREETAKRNETLKALRAAVAKFNNADFGELPNFTVSTTPDVKPISSHPRVWVNSDTLDDVIANLTAEENRKYYNQVKSIAEAALKENGALDTSLESNYTADSISKMESLAFMYLITDDEIYGYAAIVHAFNFMNTVKFSSDPIYQGTQIPCGTAFMVLAEVYDWCYDLFLPIQRKNFIAGAINKCAVLMEYGFPAPSNSSGVTGHTTGTCILRNSLAAVIAFYDEYPDMYNNIVSLLLNNYVDYAEFTYKSGIINQGTSYGEGKLTYHIVSDLLMLYGTGEHLYDISFEEVLMSTVFRCRPDGEGIRIGDDYLANEALNYEVPVYSNAFYKVATFYAASLYKNSIAKAWYLAGGGYEARWDSQTSELSPVYFLIYNDPTVTCSETDRFNLPLVKYSSDPNSTLIVRSAWNDEAAWLTYTNMEESYAANHDHKDAGAFQIYYKGILAPDSGQYQHGYYAGIEQLYGSRYDYAYVKQTVSKNGLLIYNPAFETTSDWKYSGGQTTKSILNGSGETLAEWQAKGLTEQTVSLGKSYAYDDNGDVVYAYIAGDITKAYDSETVDLVTRATMTLATNDPDHPMAFIVYDRIISDSADYKKSFVLHTMEEPTFIGASKSDFIEKNDGFTYVVGTTNAFYYTNTKGAAGAFAEDDPNDKYNGKLTSTTLLPENPEYRYVGGDGKRFWVEGENVGLEGTVAEGFEGVDKQSPMAEIGWGRVELSPTDSQKENTFLNVMYVSDADNTEYVPSVLVQSATHEGAVAFGNVVLFSKSVEPIESEISFTAPGEGKMTYYVGGMADGRWEVLANGQKVGTYDVEEGESVLTFEADANAEITVIPRFDKLTLDYMGGAPTVNVKPIYYTDVDFALPTADMLEKYAYRFVGWYKNKLFKGDAVTVIPAGTTGAKTYYAKWEKAFGVVTYHVYNGTSESELLTTNYRDEELILPTLQKPQCEFLGWYTNPEFTGDAVTSIPIGDAEDWELYAKFDGPVYYNADKEVLSTLSMMNDVEFGTMMEKESSGKFTLRLDTASMDNSIWSDPHDYNIGIRLFNSLRPVSENISVDMWLVDFSKDYMVTNGGQRLTPMNSGNTVDVVVDYVNKAITYYVNGIFVCKEDDVEGTIADLALYNGSKTDYDNSVYMKNTDGPIQLVGGSTERRLCCDAIAVYLGENISDIPEGYDKLILDLGGVTNDLFIPTTYSNADGYVLPTKEQMSDYPDLAFVGWYTNPEFTGTPIKEISAGTAGEMHLYAKYSVPLLTESRTTKLPVNLAVGDFGSKLAANGGVFTVRIAVNTEKNASWDGTADNGLRLRNALKTKGGSESYEVYLINFKGGYMVTNGGQNLTAMNSGDVVDIVADCVNETLTYYVNGALKYTEALAEGSIADDLKLYDGKNTDYDKTVYDGAQTSALNIPKDSARTFAYDELSVYIDDIVNGGNN